MSFLLGLGILIPLVIVFSFLNNFRYSLPKEFSIIPIVAMFFIDIVIVFMWYHILVEISEDKSVFKKGIAGAFAIGSFIKCGILLNKEIKNV